MRYMPSSVVALMRVALLVVLIGGTAGSIQAQDPTIEITPDTTYAEPGDTIVMTVSALDSFTSPFNDGLKGIHMVLGFDDAVVVPDTTASAFQPIEPGTLFPAGDSVTFFWNYLSGATSTLTVDIFFLPDTQTIEGPGELLKFQMNAVANGHTQVKFLELTLRDSKNRTIPVIRNGAYVEICIFPGDVNADGEVDPVDLAYLVDYFYAGGPPPVPLASGDVNCDGSVDPVDLAVMADYFYAGGTMCRICL